MEDDQETAWQALGNVAVARLAQSPTSLATANAAEDDRRRSFGIAVGPCLALVGGVGMARDDQRVWMNAAFKALAEYPMDLIEKGALEAMKVADHHSKIVPAIISAISSDWSFRKRTAHLPPAPPPRDMFLLEDTPRIVYDDAKLLSLAMTSWGVPLVSMLLKLGSITQEQYDRAITAATPE